MLNHDLVESVLFFPSQRFPWSCLHVLSSYLHIVPLSHCFARGLGGVASPLDVSRLRRLTWSNSSLGGRHLRLRQRCLVALLMSAQLCHLT